MITTALYLLRCKQMKLSLYDMDALSIGLIYDMMTESINDEVEYQEIATQEDYDNF